MQRLRATNKLGLGQRIKWFCFVEVMKQVVVMPAICTFAAHDRRGRPCSVGDQIAEGDPKRCDIVCVNVDVGVRAVVFPIFYIDHRVRVVR